MTIGSISYGISSLSSGAAQTRLAEVNTSRFFHVRGDHVVAGSFISQAERNQFAEFIRGWHYDTLRRGRPSLLRFTAAIEDEIESHDVIVGSVDVGFDTDTGSTRYSITMQRADKRVAGDSVPVVSQATSFYAGRIGAGARDSVSEDPRNYRDDEYRDTDTALDAGEYAYTYSSKRAN